MDLSPLEQVLAIVTMLTGPIALPVARRYWHRQVTIRFHRGRGPRFKEAFKLYKGSFPDDETDDEVEINRWLRESRRGRDRNGRLVAEYFVCSFRKGKARA